VRPARTRITIELLPKQAAYIDLLVKTGLYGINRGEVVRRLMTQGIATAIAAGVIPRE